MLFLVIYFFKFKMMPHFFGMADYSEFDSEGSDSEITEDYTDDQDTYSASESGEYEM